MKTKIGIMGLLGSGKTTFGDMLLERLVLENSDWVTASYAEPIKQLCCEVLEVSRDYIESRETKELGIDFYYGTDLECALYDYLELELKFSCKQMDEAVVLMRSKFGNLEKISPRKFLQYFGTDVVRAINPNAWVELLQRRNSENPAIVTDVRFENEYVDINFLVCRFENLERPEHSSEQLAWDLQFDPEVNKLSKVLEIHNKGSISALEKSVDSVILYLKDGGYL